MYMVMNVQIIDVHTGVNAEQIHNAQGRECEHDYGRAQGRAHCQWL